MIINDTILKKLENLSMLKIDKDKKTKIKKELSEIITYVDNLKELSLEGIKLFSDQNEVFLVSEDNIVDNSDIIEALSTQNTNILDNFFIVPQIIKS